MKTFNPLYSSGCVGLRPHQALGPRGLPPPRRPAGAQPDWMTINWMRYRMCRIWPQRKDWNRHCRPASPGRGGGIRAGIGRPEGEGGREAVNEWGTMRPITNSYKILQENVTVQQKTSSLSLLEIHTRKPRWLGPQGEGPNFFYNSISQSRASKAKVKNPKYYYQQRGKTTEEIDFFKFQRNHLTLIPKTVHPTKWWYGEVREIRLCRAWWRSLWGPKCELESNLENWYRLLSLRKCSLNLKRGFIKMPVWPNKVDNILTSNAFSKVQ